MKRPAGTKVPVQSISCRINERATRRRPGCFVMKNSSPSARRSVPGANNGRDGTQRQRSVHSAYLQPQRVFIRERTTFILSASAQTKHLCVFTPLRLSADNRYKARGGRLEDAGSPSRSSFGRTGKGGCGLTLRGFQTTSSSMFLIAAHSLACWIFRIKAVTAAVHFCYDLELETSFRAALTPNQALKASWEV